MRLNDAHFIYLSSCFCLRGIYVVCTCLYTCGWGIHTYAEMQIILGVGFCHFLLCISSPTALNLELMVQLAGQPVHPRDQPCRAGYNCVLPLLLFMWVVEIQTQVLVSAGSTYSTY